MVRIPAWSFAAVLMMADPVLGQQANPPQRRPDPPAAAQAGNEPTSTTARFGDWVLRCQKVEAARVCEVGQSLVAQGQSTPIVQIAFGRPVPKEKLRLTVVLQPNISLASGPRLDPNQKDAGIALTWRRCLPIGCFADSQLEEAMLKRIRSSNEKGRLTFNDAAGREIVLSFSLNGLSQALDALPKD